MTSSAKTVDEYLASLPNDRREAISTVRNMILKHLPQGYEEGMQYGMIGYFVPHSLFPAGYHCDPSQPLCFASLGSQKNHMALYLMCVYMDSPTAEKFKDNYAKTGKKLDMGKACIRFKRAEDLALDLIGQTIASVTVDRYLSKYIELLNRPKTKRSAKAESATRSQ